jgi:3-hydroxyisobutyrate dehydrogenase-like beta-hydroxyacid dehydrogenase
MLRWARSRSAAMIATTSQLQNKAMATRIGLIGLGRMGKPMAANISAAGFDLMVYDLREEPVRELMEMDAKRGHGLKEVADHAEIIALAVVDDAQVEEVVAGTGGLLECAQRGAVIIIHSTIMPATVRQLARVGADKGLQFVDAPVSGGEAGARQRQLCYMVGGAKEAFDKVRPVLAASAANIFHLGELGSGATAKVMLQVVVCINMLGIYEAELLSEKCGLDFQVFQEVLRVSSGQSFVADHWLERFKRPQDPLAIRQRRAEVLAESLSPAVRLAEELNIGLHGAHLAQRLLQRIMGVDPARGV